VLKIGNFSRAAHVTVKTLRYYGRIGLLRPAWVDRFSGYRYYSFDQLPRLNRILALKEMGFTLEQIASLLDRDLGVDELRSILHRKRLEVEERLLAEQARLIQVETRLEQIDQAGCLSDYEVVLKSVSKLPVVSVRKLIADPRQVEKWSNQTHQTLIVDMRMHGLRPTGQWISIIHNGEYTERNIDLQVAVIVDLASCTGRPAMHKHIMYLPAVPHMACVYHTGPVQGLAKAHTALYGWIQANGYDQAGPVREVCHADPEDDDASCELIELQMPVEKPSFPTANLTHGVIKEEQAMEPKFVTKPAFMLVGMKYSGKNQHQEISEMWGKFSPHIGALAEKPIQATYGWCGEMNDDGSFEYIAAVETTKADNLPDWAVVRMVPENTYAVFPHRGSLETLKDTYNYIYQTWRPQSDYTTLGYDMEVYTDEFKDFSPDSVFYIYIPVKKKN
jgi:predicted transcriptional regulator YdeE/DNA-binding transcriptional MerR regulator